MKNVCYIQFLALISDLLCSLTIQTTDITYLLFQFQPFSERIANIDVDVFHRVGHKYENDPEESETYFHKALDKWHDLNLTESFEAFQKEVPPTHTLPQLLQQKDDVVALLVKYIKLNDPLCLQPVLE